MHKSVYLRHQKCLGAPTRLGLVVRDARARGGRPVHLASYEANADVATSSGLDKRVEGARRIAARETTRMTATGPQQPQQGSRSLWGEISSRGWHFIASLVCLLGIPCIPLLIELVHAQGLKQETVMVTATVLAPTYMVSTEYKQSALAYLVVLIVGLVVLTASTYGDASASAHAGLLMFAVVFLQVLERLFAHLLRRKPFDVFSFSGGA